MRWHSRREVSNDALFLALLVDVGTLDGTALFKWWRNQSIQLSHLLQVILAAVLLQPKFLACHRRRHQRLLRCLDCFPFSA